MRIPVYEQRTSPSGTGPSVRASGQQVASIGGALQDLGRTGMGIAVDMRQREVELERKMEQEREDDAAVAATTALAEGRLYWSKELQRRSDEWSPDGPGVYDSFTKDYDEWQKKQLETAGTPRAKRYLTERFAAMRSDFGLNAYQTDRTKRVNLNVSRFETGREAARNTVFSNPDQRAVVLAEQLAGIEALTIDPDKKLELGQRLRQDIDLAAEQGFRARQGDQAYLAGRVRPVPMVTPEGQPAPAAPGRRPDFNQLFDAVVGQESGGRHTDGDGLLTSPKGARGITQVMPATGADPGYGIKPLQNESREEYLRFGREYLAAMLREFDGDTAKALAAYNAGPGRVQAAVKVGGDDWLKNMPAETRNYVASITGKVGMGPQGAPDETRGFVLGDQRFEFLPDDQLPVSFQGLSIDRRMALLNEAEQEAKQRRASEAQILQGRLRDSLAMAQDGIKDNIPPAAFAVLGDKAADAYTEYERAQRMATDIASLQGASNGELLAVATGQAARATPGTGYAAESQMDGIRSQAAQRVLQAREADPAGFVAKTVPAVTRAMQAAADPNLTPEQRATATQALARETLAAQERLGIENRRILTPGQADAIGARAMTLARPEDAANLIAGLEAEYGPQFFPQVFSELVRDKKISGELILIPNLPTQTAREAVSRLARIKETDLTANMDSDAQRIVKEAVTEKLAEFATAVPMMTRQAAETVGTYETTMRKLAYSFAATGMNPADAVEQAHTMLLGHYRFDGTMRVPASQNLSAVQRGASFMLRNDLEGIDVPRDLVGLRDPATLADEWRRTVQARPLWFTSDDDSGLVLYAQGSDGTRYRVTRGGRPVTYRWTDLVSRASTNSGRVSSGRVTQ